MLSDPHKRAAYDRYGHAGHGRRGIWRANPFAGGVDIWRHIRRLVRRDVQHGREGKPSRVQQGGDIRHDLTIEFEEAVFGEGKEDQGAAAGDVQRLPGDEEARTGRGPDVCSHCHGRGQVRYPAGIFLGCADVQRVRRTGTVITDPCATCRGEGRAAGNEMHVTVPAGVEDGTRIRYQGEGDAGRFGGPAGDLYVVLRVRRTNF